MSCSHSTARLFKAYLLKESLDRLWDYRYEGAMMKYCSAGSINLRWQRLKPFQKLADMLLGTLGRNSELLRTKVPLGVVEAINGNIKSLCDGAAGTRI